MQTIRVPFASAGGIYSDRPVSLQKTSDNGYIVAGYSANQCALCDGSYDILVVKFDAQGAIEWQKRLGGSDDETPCGILQTADGGFLVAGNSNSDDIAGVTKHGNRDGYIIKLDALGDVLWQRMYGGSGIEYLSSLQPTADGGFILAGSSTSNDISGVTNNGGSDLFVLKIDANGEVVWQRMYGGEKDDEAYEVHQAIDGGFILAGYADGNVGYGHAYVIKLDAYGQPVWDKSYVSGVASYANSILQTSDGGYVIAGAYTQKKLTNVIYWVETRAYLIARFNGQGQMLWQKSYGGSGLEWEQPIGIQPYTDGGYLVFGSTLSQEIIWPSTEVGYVLRIDKDGQQCDQMFLGDMNRITPAGDGTYMAASGIYVDDVQEEDMFLFEIGPF